MIFFFFFGCFTKKYTSLLKLCMAEGTSLGAL